MDALIIHGPAKLRGKVTVSGSKNTVLPYFFASLLFDKPIEFRNVPRLWDIETTLGLLNEMGCQTTWNKEEGAVVIDPTVKISEASYDWVKKMRAGILALGPLVARMGEARVSLPGGCAIGARPVGFHIDALRQMGAEVEVEQGYIHAKVPKRLHGAHIVFPQVSVTGTENVLMVAVVAEGKTTLENAAQEPEVVALGEWLNRCGAQIKGLGTSTLEIEGGRLVAPAAPVEVPPDRIEAGTWIAAAAATRSELVIDKVEVARMGAVLQSFRAMGVGLEASEAGTRLTVIPADVYRPIQVETQPYPGFPTDMQAQMIVAMCQASGASTIRETIFENRFMHVAELQRLGAQISIHGNLAVVEGPCVFKAAPLMATDLRASASLVLAALCAEGATRVSRIYHLDRGYQRLDKKLQELGVNIERVSESPAK